MNNTYEQEINLKDLLFFILHRWRPIIAAAVILAVLLGGYKFGKGMQEQQDASHIAEIQESYDQAVNEYEQAKSGYERDIEGLTAKIDYEEKYQENSLLLQIDPYNKWVASADIFVKTENTSMQPGAGILPADPADSVVKAYASAIGNGSFLMPLAEKKNTDISYLKELISVTPDYEGNVLEVSVSAPDEQGAREILDLVLENLNSMNEEVQRKLGAHSIAVMNENVGTVTDPMFADAQNEKSNDLTNIHKTLEESQKALKALKKPERPDTLSKMGTVKSGIKYGVLGGVLGAFASAFFACIAFVMKQTVYSPEELKSRFGVKVLGVFSKPERKRRFSGIDAWLNRLEGRGQAEADQVYEKIAASILNLTQSERKILLTGTVEEERLKELEKVLKAKLPDIVLTAAGDMNKNPSVLRSLPEFDAVILVEAMDTSKYSGIEKEIESICDAQKRMIGCIVL